MDTAPTLWKHTVSGSIDGRTWEELATWDDAGDQIYTFGDHAKEGRLYVRHEIERLPAQSPSAP